MKTLISAALLLAWGTLVSSAQVVDVHSHIIPSAYTDFLRAHHAELQETFPLPKWDADSHLAFMDEMGIDCSVLSLPAPQPYFGDSAESAAKVRELNELAAKVRDEHPGKFLFLATLPLPDVQAAALPSGRRKSVYTRLPANRTPATLSANITHRRRRSVC